MYLEDKKCILSCINDVQMMHELEFAIIDSKIPPHRRINVLGWYVFIKSSITTHKVFMQYLEKDPSLSYEFKRLK
jgi:hypothetical protein